jgi:PAS domain S-box-containing protein
VVTRLEACLRDGTPLSSDLRVIQPDGTERYVAVSAHVILDEQGRPTRLIGTSQDITERRMAAVGLERRVRIEQSLTQVSQLLAESASVDVGAVLRLLGEALGADRMYLLQSRVDPRGVVVEQAEEWCAPGVTPALEGMRGVQNSVAPWWLAQIESRGSILITDPGELPAEASPERQLLEAYEVTSCAAVPLRDPRQGLVALLGFDLVNSASAATEDDVRVLRTTAEMMVTYFARERAEREIVQRDAILEAVSFMAERFLRTSEWQKDLSEALSQIGAAAGASRAYLFENAQDESGCIRVSQRAEWVADGIEPQIDNPALQNVRLADIGLQRWEQGLMRNDPLQELVRDMAETEREHLESQAIRSVLLIPIFVGESWWGFLGFDDCVSDREWSHAERDVLMAAGRMIGAGIQRQRAEEALRESEMRFIQLSDNIPEVFFMTTVDMSEILYLSPSFERVWQRTMQEAFANPMLFMQSIVPEDLPILYADMELSRSGKGDPMRHVDYRIYRPDRSIRWIRNRVFQIPDQDGRPYRVAGVCTDITDQKQLEEDLRRANRIEAIGHLAAGIAHEINTPIQYVGDNLRFLDDSFTDVGAAMGAYRTLLEHARAGTVTDEVIAAVAAAVDNADVDYLLEQAPRASAQALDGVLRVAEIVRAMKEFSHPGTGLKVPTDLNQAIRSTTTVARNEWKYVAELVTELDDCLPLVPCFPCELNQAILNLVVNAAHAIAERQLREGTEAPGAITVGTASLGEWVEIRVSDTGTGIPLDLRPRIFDPFFTTKEVGRGTGQGLTFVHSIVVEKHGGTVAFETEEGVGTTFTVRLPSLADARGVGAAA